jgi:hypothetical protein
MKPARAVRNIIHDLMGHIQGANHGSRGHLATYQLADATQQVLP